MIDLKRVIDQSVIIGDLPVSSKEDAIKHLLDTMFSGNMGQGRSVSKQKVYDEIIARETVSTTGIGFGFAIPHARIEGWGDFALAVGICRQGMDFNSVDKVPAKVICLMVSSAEEPYIILQAASTLLHFFEKHNGVDAFIRDYAHPAAMTQAFHAFPIEAQEQIVAHDIMRPVQCSVCLNDPIEKATRLMHVQHFDVLPVLDAQGKFAGEISCADVFQYGMPNFFQTLHTVSFVRHIDPFEKYFRIHRNLKVENFCRATEPISQERTLIEIVFELAVKKRSKLFVTDADNTLRGVIDRFTIIDKILIF